MGLVVDSSVLISGERRGLPVEALFESLRIFGHTDLVLAASAAVELTHGVYRAQTLEQREKREAYVQTILNNIDVAPLTLPIAQLAGRIDGEQTALGNRIDLADLLIGSTALHLGFGVVTFNRAHFERIPQLPVLVP